MAIACAEAVAEIVATTNATTYDFGSFTPAAHAVLVVIAMVRTTVATGSMVNVSGTALTWNKKASATFNAGADTVYVFWARTNGNPSASVYRVDVTGDTGAGCIAYMFSFTAADYLTGDPIRQVVTAAATSTNPTGSFPLAMRTANGYCAAWLGALSSSNPANVSTPPTSWTEVGDNGFATPTSNGSGAFRATGETGTAVTFTASSTTWGFAAVEVWEHGAGPRPPYVVGQSVARA